MTHLKSFFYFCLFLTAITGRPGYSETLMLNSIDNENDKYTLGLLKMALSYSDKQYDLQFTHERLAQSTLIEETAKGDHSIMWAGTTRELEETLIPIRVPLYKGLLGHRIFIIKKGQQHLFDNIKSRRDLDDVAIGQGRTWSDTEILEANGFDVVTANKYEGLFHMVDGDRFDAFPRGVHEPWAEISARPELELEVERKIMLVYKMPFYIFVNPKMKDLAQDIEEGLLEAIADGSFDNYFFANHMVKDALTRAKLHTRTAFQMKNPLLHPDTPVDNPDLWFDPFNTAQAKLGMLGAY